MLVGIYKITNLINGKKYYGSSVDIKARWRTHKFDLRRNSHSNPHLQSSWNKHGENTFKFEVILLCEEFELFKHEQWFLDNVVCWGVDYNIAECAEAPRRGAVLSDEHKRKISKANTGIKRSEETRIKISEACKGKTFSEETRRKLSEANKGKVPSEETKLKISKAKSGENNYNSILIKERVLMIRRMYLTKKYTQETLGKLFNIDRTNISRIVNYKAWKYT